MQQQIMINDSTHREIYMSNNVLERLFKLQAHGTTIKTEVVAGLTTFAAMSYILVVNPGILGLSGMPIEGLILSLIHI